MSTQDSKEREIAYVIEDAVLGEPFEVFYSPNAWWCNRGKVCQLIGGLKSGLTLKKALFLADISQTEYRNFLKEHIEFCIIKLGCKLSSRAKSFDMGDFI